MNTVAPDVKTDVMGIKYKRIKLENGNEVANDGNGNIIASNYFISKDISIWQSKASDKEFTKQDMIEAIEMAREYVHVDKILHYMHSDEEIIDKLQSTIAVELENGTIKTDRDSTGQLICYKL